MKLFSNVKTSLRGIAQAVPRLFLLVGRFFSFKWMVRHYRLYAKRKRDDIFQQAGKSEKGVYDLFSAHEIQKFSDLNGIERLIQKEEMRQWEIRYGKG